MSARFIRIASIAFAVAWVDTTLPSAQQSPAPAAPATSPAPQGPAPTFRSGVDSVSVDAIVTDKQGRPVTDLKPEDFEIRESEGPGDRELPPVEIDDGRNNPECCARDSVAG